MKKLLSSALVISALLLTLLTISQFAGPSTAHAAAANTSANNCVSSGAVWSQYTGTQITVCKVGNGNVQTTMDAYGGCILFVSFDITYHGLFSPVQGNSSSQACSGGYSHTFPPVHETGKMQVEGDAAITVFGAGETTFATVDLTN